MRNSGFMVLFITTGLMLSGCETILGGSQEKTTKPVGYSLDKELADAASSVQKSVRALAEADQAPLTSPAEKSEKVPPGLDQKITVQWSGPIKALLEKAVLQSGSYSLQVYGKEPAVPVIVTVDAKGEALYHIIKNAALQAGSRAMVTLDVSARRIILRYPAA